MDSSLQIYLDSKLANRYYDSTNNCEYILPVIELDSQYHFLLSVVNASIPHSFYNMNLNNNTLQWIEDPYVTFVVHSVTIPVGNYSINQFITELQTLLTPLVVSYNNITNKITFTHPTATFAFYSNNNTCFELLGFSNVNHFSPVSPRVLTSDICCNMFTTRSLCLCSNIHTDNVHINRPMMQSIICTIPVNSAPNGIVTYANTNSFKNNLFSNIMKSITIKFMDQDGNSVDLNGCHYNLTLQLDIFKYVQD